MEEQRSALEISSDRVYKIWNEWQLRVMVLLSLALQIGLIMFGNRRKRTTSNGVRLLVWLMYLSADSVAILALGVLSNSVREDTSSCSDKSADPRSVIVAVWASFLLLHLGGSDTITAYSLEDNDLWLRHLLGLVVQVVGAIYVLSRSQLHTHHHEIMFLAIPIFVVGIIKYGERTWALRSASRMRLIKTFYKDPKIQDSNTIALFEHDLYPKTRSRRVNLKDTIKGSNHLHEAFILFEFLRDAYGGVPLDKEDQEESFHLLRGKKSEEAFQLVDIELGFLYDMIYTKAPIIWYNKSGFILRIIAFLSSICALLMFCLIINKKRYSNIDTYITYLFAFGAIFLEIISFILMIISDWFMILLSEYKNQWAKRVYQAISSSWLASTNDHKIRWSGSIGQYNLFEFAAESPSMFDAVLNRIGIYDLLMKNRCTSWEKVSAELKELVFQKLQENHEKVWSWRGEKVLQKNCSLGKFEWSIAKEVDFDYSIIVWHIATTICYDLDLARCQKDSSLDTKCKMSKSLSDYMIYLLFVNPSMLPMEKGRRTFLVARFHAKYKKKSRKMFNEDPESIKRNGRKAQKLVLSNLSEAEDSECGTLNEGYKLAKLLEGDLEEQRFNNATKWEMLSEVWVEMLCYAAYRCEWKDHAKQLRRGGEFLTHVNVLMFQLRRGGEFLTNPLDNE